MSFKSDAIVKHNFFLTNIMLHLRISVSFAAYHRARIVGCFLSISFALKNMICRSDWPCFGPRTLLNDKARD